MTVAPVRIMPRWVAPFIWAMALGVAILLGLLAVQLYRTTWRPPPFSYTSDVYLPIKASARPGDTISWHPQLIVQRTPTLLMTVRTLWDVSDERTIVPEIDPKYVVWLDTQRGQTIVSRFGAFKLSTDLGAGLYEVRRASTALNSDAAAYWVPFVIPESCFKGVGKP